jgi:hypothetical protein
MEDSFFEDGFDEYEEMPSERDVAVASWEANGYIVHPDECPECGALMVKKVSPAVPAIRRWLCTNYGGCEYAPG